VFGSIFCMAQRLTTTTMSATSAATTTTTTTTTTKVLSDSDVAAFERDGYLFVKGLLKDEMLDEFVKAGDEVLKMCQRPGFPTFRAIQKGMIVDTPSLDDNKGEEKDSEDAEKRKKIVETFRKVALWPWLGQACADLMQLDPETQNIRILRDVFLAKPVAGKEKCDWHVDDQGFWPESFQSTASEQSGKDQHGINVWIAMDDMPAKYEGSMTVATGSHKAEYRHDGYRAIGQDRSKDEKLSKDELFEVFSKGAFTNGTCTMHLSDPELRARIEASKVVFDLEKGDAIFATRLLFHRTLSVTDEGEEYYNSIGKENLNRYSIRYVPGTAKLPAGYGFEYCVQHDMSNAGRTLNEVVEHEGSLWYPQVWPTMDEGVKEKLDELSQTKFPTARVKSDHAAKDFFAEIFKRMHTGQQQQQSPQSEPSNGEEKGSMM
jgi:Phytanoyl-CoA dioxygenase (PhyH)